MRTLTLLGLTLLVGCTTPTPAPTTPSAGTSTLDGSWIDAVVDEPGRFSTLASGEAREGWVALHSNDLGAAAKAFAGSDTPIARGRALWELAELHHGLADSGDRAWENTFATWSEKSTLPVGSALSYVAALAAIEQGDQQLAGAWLELTANAKDPEVALAASLLATAQPGQPIAGDELPPLTLRYNLHLQARESGDLSKLAPLADQPLVVETEPRPDGSSLERRFYDPQMLRSYARAYEVQARQALGSAPLEALGQAPADQLAALLFGPVAFGSELAAEASRATEAPGTFGASGPALASLGLEPELCAEDDAEWARRQVRQLDAALDAWAAGARDGATPDGQALLDDLQLVPIYRSRLLLALGRKALLAEHPWQALAFAQLALDLESSRGINHVNHPGLRAIIVEAQLRTGHTREALDAIQPLLGGYPAAKGLNEVLGDLAILQGLDRYGDSKEN